MALPSTGGVESDWPEYEPTWKAIEARVTGSQPAQKAVAYLDLGAGGYMDIGTDLNDEQLASLPKGRHMLGIVGTYGVDGYVSAQPAPSVPSPDIYVSDTGHAWDAKLNPELRHSPNATPYWAQPSPSFADAYQGAMEDVAIWKKRALEAEDLNRKFVAEINGPAHTCEPTQPAASVPVEAIGKMLEDASQGALFGEDE